MNTKAFTLVELIVVITILAILATLAFISLQGYSQDARNSKVLSDIRTLISAIETASTKDSSFSMVNLVEDPGTYGTAVSTGSFLSGVYLSDARYEVGKINFPFLKQSKNDFQDSEGNDYIASIILKNIDPEDVFYQIIGQTKNNAGTYDTIVKGTYVKIGTGDIDGLVSAPGYLNGLTGQSINIPSPGIY